MVLGAAQVARAQGADIALSWSAPAGCPDERDVLEEARRLLGAPSPRDKPVAARAVVRFSAKRWHVDVVTESDGAPGHRSFHAATCEEVADATALTLALVVNPEAVALSQPSPPQEPAPPRPAPVATETPRPPAPAPRSVRAFASLGGAADVGTFPRVGLGVAGGAGVSVWRLRFSLTLSGQPSRDVPLASGDVGARFTKLTAGLRACAILVPDVVELDACLAEELAYVRAESYGIVSPKVATTTWEETLLGGSATLLAAPSWGVRLDGFLGFPAQRREFTVAPLGVVHALPAVTARIGLGVEMRF